MPLLPNVRYPKDAVLPYCIAQVMADGYTVFTSRYPTLKKAKAAAKEAIGRGYPDVKPSSLKQVAAANKKWARPYLTRMLNL
jgi:hypothetical protein